MIEFLWISIFTAILITLGGVLVRKASPPHLARRRSLVYLLAMSLLGGIVLTIAAVWPVKDGTPAIARAAYLLTPVLLGILALLVLHIPRPGFTQAVKRPFILAAVLLLGVVFYGWAWWSGGNFLLHIAAIFLLLAAVWMLSRPGPGLVLTGLAVLALLGLAGLKFQVTAGFERPEWQGMAWGVLWMALPALSTALAAALVYAGVNVSRPGSTPPLRPLYSFLHLALAALLVAGLAYVTFWYSVWDHTSDGLGGLFMLFFGIPVAIAAGMVLTAQLPGQRRLAGVGYLILVPVTLITAFNQGWDLSYHALTESRAARIQNALDRFHARQGRYPDTLAELAPGEMWFIPQPVLLRTETWCYQGEPQAYRLGAFYREYFGTPVSLRTYASAGSLQTDDEACSQQLEAVKARYDPRPFSDMPISTPEPQPLSPIAIERTPLQPVYQSGRIIPGSWSPDGRFYLFSSVDPVAVSPSRTLVFLDAVSGQVCPVQPGLPVGEELHKQHAWLPGGVLLFLDESGALHPITPCGAQGEPYPGVFESLEAYDTRSGRALLKSPGAFWILDPQTRQVEALPGISPNPYEYHWDQAAWSPGGVRLAIARLNGRDASTGSTLFILDGATGAVQTVLDLPDATDQSAPWVEWLSEDELLLSGQSELKLYEFQTDPPGLTGVVRELFGLSLSYPDEILGFSSLPETGESGYHLALAANHPRSQVVYVYHSGTRQVEVFPPDRQGLLLLSIRPAIGMNRTGFAPGYRDEYDLIWPGSPGKDPVQLSIEGHTPRAYPHVWAKYLPAHERLVIASTQGVSLVSLPGGEMLRFWELVGSEASLTVILSAAPGDQTLLALADGRGVYLLPQP